MFIDSHCHLEMLKDINSVVERARRNNVGIIVYNSVNHETMKYALELSERYKEIKVALGIYPIDALKLNDNEIDKEIEFIRKNRKKIIAIGEIGIDLKESKDTENKFSVLKNLKVEEKFSSFDKQKKNFIRFLDLSKELDIPVFIHSRGAEEKIIDILEREKCKKVVIHCFMGNFKLIDRIVNNGWTLSIPANITFSEHFQKVVERVKIDSLLCETDSPFLHPVKGMRNTENQGFSVPPISKEIRVNEPANVVESYKMIAKIKKISLKECEKKIEDNFRRLFEIIMV